MAIMLKAALVVCFALCAAAQQATTVIIYRSPNDHRRLWAPAAFCDGSKVASLSGGKFVTLSVAPGRHEFRSNNKKRGVAIDAKPGETYYLRVNGGVGISGEYGTLDMVPPEQGRYETKSMDLVSASGSCQNGNRG
jgi:hypothetical protein